MASAAEGEPPGGEIPVADGDAASLLGEPVALRRRFGHHGLVVMRGLLHAGLLAEAAGEVAARMARAGLLAAQHSGSAALCGPAGHGTGAPAAGASCRDLDPLEYRSLFSLRVLHELPHAARLRDAMAALLDDGDLVVHPRPALRTVPPAAPGRLPPTPAHQDHLGMQGSEHAIVAWIPLTDCPLELGPVAVARGSHRHGRRPYRPVAGARVLACDTAGLEGAWYASPLSAGDVVLFHALSVHRALPNTTGHWRLSLDFRCQRAAEPLCELTVRDDPALPFDELYAGWPADSPALAWRRRELRLVPFDASVLASR